MTRRRFKSGSSSIAKCRYLTVESGLCFHLSKISSPISHDSLYVEQIVQNPEKEAFFLRGGNLISGQPGEGVI